MLVKLPKSPCCKRLDLHAENITSIELAVINPHKQTEQWRVSLGYPPLPNGHVFWFDTSESAEAWADEVRGLVNWEESPKPSIAAAISDQPVMTSDGYLWWKGCVYEKRPAFRPKEPQVDPDGTLRWQGREYVTKDALDQWKKRAGLVKKTNAPVEFVVADLKKQIGFLCPKCGQSGSYYDDKNGVWHCNMGGCGWSGPRKQCFVNPVTPVTQFTTENVFLPTPGDCSIQGQASALNKIVQSQLLNYGPCGGTSSEDITTGSNGGSGGNGGNGGDVEMACGGGGSAYDEDGGKAGWAGSPPPPSFADWHPTPEQYRRACRIYLNDIHHLDSNAMTLAMVFLKVWQRVFAQQGEKK